MRIPFIVVATGDGGCRSKGNTGNKGSHNRARFRCLLQPLATLLPKFFMFFLEDFICGLIVLVASKMIVFWHKALNILLQGKIKASTYVHRVVILWHSYKIVTFF